MQPILHAILAILFMASTALAQPATPPASHEEQAIQWEYEFHRAKMEALELKYRQIVEAKQRMQAAANETAKPEPVKDTKPSE